MRKLTDRQRRNFEAKIDRNGPKVRNRFGRCWIWKGYRRNGAGIFNFNGLATRVERIALAHFRARRPRLHAQIHHLCGNRDCVNPDHLHIGRPPRPRGAAPGKGHWNARLRNSDIPRIKSAAMAGRSQRSIAASFGVSRSAVRDVIGGRRWNKPTGKRMNDKNAEV